MKPALAAFLVLFLLKAVVPAAGVPAPEEILAEMPVKEEIVAEVPVKEEIVAEVPVKEEIVEEIVAGVPVKEEILAEVPVKEEIVAEVPVKEEIVAEVPEAGVPVNQKVVAGGQVPASVGNDRMGALQVPLQLMTNQGNGMWGRPDYTSMYQGGSQYYPPYYPAQGMNNAMGGYNMGGYNMGGYNMGGYRGGYPDSRFNQGMFHGVVGGGNQGVVGNAGRVNTGMIPVGVRSGNQGVMGNSGAPAPFQQNSNAVLHP